MCYSTISFWDVQPHVRTAVRMRSSRMFLCSCSCGPCRDYVIMFAQKRDLKRQDRFTLSLTRYDSDVPQTWHDFYK